jgi:hypothetical protein
MTDSSANRIHYSQLFHQHHLPFPMSLASGVVFLPRLPAGR